VPSVLAADLRLPLSLRCTEALDRFENLVVWFSDGGQRSKLHFDGGDFLLTQIDGQKEVTMVDPLDSLYLYADHAMRYGSSPIDPADVDLEQFPRAADVPVIAATLSAGDVLFIPHRWWHVVHSLEGRNLAYTLQLFTKRPAAVSLIPGNEYGTYYSIPYALAFRDSPTPDELLNCDEIAHEMPLDHVVFTSNSKAGCSTGMLGHLGCAAENASDLSDLCKHSAHYRAGREKGA